MRTTLIAFFLCCGASVACAQLPSDKPVELPSSKMSPAPSALKGESSATTVSAKPMLPNKATTSVKATGPTAVVSAKPHSVPEAIATKRKNMKTR